MDAYKKDGVDIDIGDHISKFGGRICSATYGNSRFVEVITGSDGYFRGSRDFVLRNLPGDTRLSAGMDGNGTKPVLTTVSHRHRDAARDLYAMTFGDQTRYGKMPLVLLNQFDASTLGRWSSQTLECFEQLLEGFEEASRLENAVLFGGETAELGPLIGSEDSEAITKFVLSGCAIAVSHPDLAIDGRNLAPGQVVVALRERGFRCNGISAVRKALKLRFTKGWGPFKKQWWDNPEAKQAIYEAAEPSVLYDPFLVDVNGWTGNKRIPVSAIAHLSGGGIRDKFGVDILARAKLCAVLDDLWDPPKIMRDCAKWRRLEKGIEFGDRQIHQTWHAGQGVLAVMDEGYVDQFIARAAGYGIDAKKCGRIYPAANDDSILTIHSKFSGEKFHYKLTA